MKKPQNDDLKKLIEKISFPIILMNSDVLTNGFDNLIKFHKKK